MKKPDRKKIIIAATAAVLVVAIGLGIWFGVGRGRSEPVKVYAFSGIGMTEYWGDSQESYGPVTTDKIQTVFLSSTQTVTEMKVAQGDTVKKGDILMTFDTTLSDLQLERKRLEVEKLKLDLENAQKKLTEILNMKPMSIVIPDDPGDSGDDGGGDFPEDSHGYVLSTNSDYDGSSEEKALICWLRDSTAVDSGILEAARALAEEFQNKNREPEPTTEPTEEPTTESTEESTEEPTTESTAAPSTESTTEPTGTQPPAGESGEGEGDAHSSPSATGGDEEEHVSWYYIVFKVTEGDKRLGARKFWQGMYINMKNGSLQFKFFDASVVPDHTIVTEDPDEDPDIDMPDMGSGYTAAQLAQLRSEQEKKIKELRFNIKMKEADYKIMQTEISDGNIYADFDGKVVSLLTEDEARNQNLPVIKVSGGGGFYIEGSVSELEKDKMQIGQEVTVNDWNTGMTYSGKIVSMGDFPTDDNGWNGTGNPNVSYYPFTVFVDETADLQAGQYVSVQYSSAASENGIYLENPFVRTENGQSYVYVQGADGKLEKRAVTTGKALWGSYTEILSGLTEDDLIAFPYGKNLKPGAATVESDLRDLYSY